MLDWIFLYVLMVLAPSPEPEQLPLPVYDHRVIETERRAVIRN